jgi:hypothetical protein
VKEKVSVRERECVGVRIGGSVLICLDLRSSLLPFSHHEVTACDVRTSHGVGGGVCGSHMS